MKIETSQQKKKIVRRLKKRIVVNNETGCWEWQGACNDKGYGNIRLFGKTVSVHRLSYEIYKGPIPNGLYILHICDNRKCCNPDHLYAGTQLDNMRDMDRRGRRNPPIGDRNAMKIHSLKGERNGRSKLKNDDIYKIRQLLSEGRTKSEIARMFGVSRLPITNIAFGRGWSHIKTGKKVSM